MFYSLIEFLYIQSLRDSYSVLLVKASKNSMCSLVTLNIFIRTFPSGYICLHIPGICSIYSVLTLIFPFSKVVLLWSFMS